MTIIVGLDNEQSNEQGCGLMIDDSQEMSNGSGLAFIDSIHNHLFYYSTVSQCFLMSQRCPFLPETPADHLVLELVADQQIKRFAFQIFLLTNTLQENFQKYAASMTLT